MLVPVSAHGSASGQNCALASTMRVMIKAAVRHLRRSCDLSSLTNSAAHSRASSTLPASLKARAFAKAWLSADRSAGDSFPVRALRALRSAAGVLRIILIQLGFGGRQISTVYSSMTTSICQPARGGAERSRTRGCESSAAHKWRLRQRAELIRRLLTGVLHLPRDPGVSSTVGLPVSSPGATNTRNA